MFPDISISDVLTAWLGAILEFHIYHPFQAIGVLLALYCVLFGLYNQVKWQWIKTIAGPPFLILDCLNNLTAFTIVSLDLPREFLVSGRLNRYGKYEGMKDLTLREKWNRQLYRIFKPILNFFDKDHIK